MTARTFHGFALVVLSAVSTHSHNVAAQETTCTGIGLSATCHSCIHAVAGPFADVNAQAHDASVVSAGLNQSHTYYRVALMASATVGPHAGAARYHPTREEPTQYAFYRASDYTIRVFDDQGVEVLPRYAFTIDPNTDCSTIGYPSHFVCAPLLPYADVFVLNGVDHTVRFEGAADATVGLVIENLSSIGGCVDAMVDAGVDASDDDAGAAGVDASVDAGEDARIDAGLDAGDDQDASTGMIDGAIWVDAGDDQDAAPTTDAGQSDTGVDGSVPDSKPRGGGCSCNVVASSTHGGDLPWTQLFTLGALGGWQLRRRRAGEKPS